MEPLRDHRVLIAALCAAASLALPVRALQTPPLDAFGAAWHAYVEASRSVLSREVPTARWLLTRAGGRGAA